MKPEKFVTRKTNPPVNPDNAWAIWSAIRRLEERLSKVEKKCTKT